MILFSAKNASRPGRRSSRFCERSGESGFHACSVSDCRGVVRGHNGRKSGPPAGTEAGHPASESSGLVRSTALRPSMCSSIDDHASSRGPIDSSGRQTHSASVEITCLFVSFDQSMQAAKPGSCCMMRPVGASRWTSTAIRLRPVLSA